MTEKLEGKAAAKAVDDGSHERHKHPILTDVQVDEAKASAKTKALSARRKDAMKRLEEEETQRLLVEEGLSVGAGPLDEMVSITLDLAPHQPWLSINGKRYEHRRTYTVRRSVANDLMFMQYKGKDNESTRLGEDRFSAVQSRRAPTVSHVGGQVTRVA